LTAQSEPIGWRNYLPQSFRPYTETAPLAALFLGISSGFPYAMIAATLTTRLAQSGIDKKTVTAFALAFLVYNLKWAWAWMVDGVRLPILGRLGQRVSWLVFSGVLVIAAVINLAFVDPTQSIALTAQAAILMAAAGATFDIVIDAYRIEWLEPRQLGVGSGMMQYGWRIGSVAAAALALVVSQRLGWDVGYALCAMFALPAMAVGLLLGEPPRRRAPTQRQSLAAVAQAIVVPLAEFSRRKGALLVLLFILLHKIGDTLTTLTFRLLLNHLQFANDEIAFFDVGFGFWGYLAGIFLGGMLYTRIGMQRSVVLSLVLMAVSNLSFAGLALIGHSNWAMAGTICFENIASGIGSVTVTAYFSALCDLRYTASQYALISAAASVVGRILTGTSAGWLIERLGYVYFYLFTTLIAIPGVLLFWRLMRSGDLETSMGTAANTANDAPQK
jgi:MFS transporter, PAT family, beta-lactamase induction signal transducer AmpG